MAQKGPSALVNIFILMKDYSFRHLNRDGYNKKSYTRITRFSFPGLINVLFISFFMFLGIYTVTAQSPSKIAYQAVIRDMANAPVSDQTLGVQITLRQGSAGGTNIYRELQTKATNANGLLSLVIGEGTVQNGSLNAVNWGAGPYFVELEIDQTGGTAYTLSETQELLSVPYAMYASTSSQAISAGMADVAGSFSGSAASGAPLGLIVPFSGPEGNIPNGWLLCDGAAYDVGQYPELFSLIGTTYGSAPNRFRVPDFRGRGPVGRDPNQTEFDALGKTGGEKAHTLTVSEMPAHNHGGSTGSAGSHSHTYGTRGFGTGTAGGTITSSANGMDGSFDDQNAQTQFGGEHPHSITSQGAGAPHNNLQPYLTMNFIIKAK